MEDNNSFPGLEDRETLGTTTIEATTIEFKGDLISLVVGPADPVRGINPTTDIREEMS